MGDDDDEKKPSKLAKAKDLIVRAGHEAFSKVVTEAVMEPELTSGDALEVVAKAAIKVGVKEAAKADVRKIGHFLARIKPSSPATAALRDADQTTPYLDTKDVLDAMELAEGLPEFEELVEERVKAQGAGGLADVEVLVNAWRRLKREVADGRTRRMLLGALGKALGVDAADDALTLRIFESLEGLDYDDTRLLRVVVLNAAEFGYQVRPGLSLERAAGQRLVERRLMTLNQPGICTASELGEHVVAFLESLMDEQQ